MRRPKKIPLRTCVGCRTILAKSMLVRVVRKPDGTVTVDATGKLSGRGAYLCRSQQCLEEALKRKSLERALQSALDRDVVDQLLLDMQQMD